MTDKELNLLKAQAADILRTGVCFIQEGRQLSEGVLKLSAALAAAQERAAKYKRLEQWARNLPTPVCKGGELPLAAELNELDEILAALSQSSHEQARRADVPEDCGNCHRCLEGKAVCYGPYEIAEALTRMIVCPECGNKRCPKATDHHLACTGSNDPGQPGSIYAAAPTGKEGK